MSQVTPNNSHKLTSYKNYQNFSFLSNLMLWTLQTVTANLAAMHELLSTTKEIYNGESCQSNYMYQLCLVQLMLTEVYVSSLPRQVLYRPSPSYRGLLQARQLKPYSIATRNKIHWLKLFAISNLLIQHNSARCMQVACCQITNQVPSLFWSSLTSSFKPSAKFKIRSRLRQSRVSSHWNKVKVKLKVRRQFV